MTYTKPLATCLPLQALPRMWHTSGVAALDHEAADVAVKYCAIVVAAGTERQEVLCGTWHLLAVYFQLQVAKIRVQCDGLRECLGGVK